MTTVHRQAQAPANLGTEVIGVPAGSDIELDLRLEAVMEGVLVSGTAQGHAVGECVRCLGDVEQDVDVELQELYVYPDRTTPTQDEDVRELEGELIDLEPALRDAVVLELPFQPLCSPDCPGLCSVCGARLAEDPGHSHQDVDPRWAALQSLLADGEGGAPTTDKMKES